MGSSGSEKEIHCSFCGKDNLEVLKMIAGPTAFICNECILLCLGIMEEGEGVKIPEKIASMRESENLRNCLETALKSIGKFYKLEIDRLSPLLTVLNTIETALSSDKRGDGQVEFISRRIKTSV